jgi:hypothetical protein
MRILWCAQVLVVCLSCSALSQTPSAGPAAGDSGQQIVQKTASAFSSAPINSISFSGTAHAIAGSLNETGSFTASVQADGRFDFHLDAGGLSQSEKAGAFEEVATCSWAGPDGIEHAAAEHNCWRSLNWLLPAFSLLSHQATLKADLRSDSGTVSGQTLVLSRSLAARSASTQAMLIRLSTVKLSTDPNTSLPASVTFNLHPDDDANRDIPVLVRYSDYRRVSGVSMPYRIQKYINGGLSLDLQVDTAQIN